MRLTDYLQKKESAVMSVEAYQGKYSTRDDKKGKLAVTPHRVVFVRDKMVADISVNGVDSIEYRAPSYPVRFLYWAAGCFCLFLLFASFSLVGGQLGGFASFASVISFILSFSIAVTGLVYRRSMLTLSTSNRTFEFVSRDDSLADIAYALRGHETR